MLTTTRIGQSVGSYESAKTACDAISKRNHHKRLQILVLPLRYATDLSAGCMFSALNPDATDFAIFGLHHVAVFWGFVTLEALGKLLIVTTTSFMIPRAFCSARMPMFLLLNQPDITPHSSFSHYHQPCGRANEASLSELTDFVKHRLAMLSIGLESSLLDPQIIYLPTNRSVDIDNFVYFLILASISDLRFKHTYNMISRDTVADVWIKAEVRITNQRMNLIPLRDLVSRFLPNHCIAVTKVPLVLKQWRPFDREFISMPFERVPPRLLRERAVVMHGGFAYVPRSLFHLLCIAPLSDIHKHNFKSFENHPTINTPNLQALMSFIRARFVSMCSVPSVGIKASLSQVLRGPPCMKTFLLKATDLKFEPHLKYNDRVLFSRYLFAMQWSTEDVLRMWRPKMRHVYRRAADDPSIVSSLKGTFNYTKKRVAQSSKVGISCWDMCAQNLCPFSVQSNIGAVRSACASKHGMTQVESPQHFTLNNLR
jgi:hypothetical protein